MKSFVIIDLKIIHISLNLLIPKVLDSLVNDYYNNIVINNLKMRKILPCVYILLALLFTSCRSFTQADKVSEIKKRGVLIVGATGDYKPMSFFDADANEYVGFDAALAEDLAASLDVKLQYVKTSWPTLMRDTLAGKFDLALCGITITEMRKKAALMSDGYLGNGKTVRCCTEDAGKYVTLEAINKKSVRVMENPGGLNEKFARANLPDAMLIIHNVNEEIPRLVAEGKADVMITEIMEAEFYASRDARLAAPLLNAPFSRGQLGALMSPGSESLLKYVNKFIKRERKSGRLDELKQIYLRGQGKQNLPEKTTQPCGKDAA